MDYSLMLFSAVVGYWCVMRCIGIPEGTPFRKLCWGDKLAIVIPCLVALYFVYFIMAY